MDKLRSYNVNNKKIGRNSPVFIIAEIGINHNGDINIAKELIDKAFECGADSVKFQSFNTEKLISVSTSGINEEERNSKLEIFNAIKRLELSEDMHYQLKDYCENKGIIFFSTVFDVDNLELIKKLNVPLIKIASCDLNNFPLLKKIAKLKIPVILSTGMAFLSEVDEAIRIFEENDHFDISLLHCVSNYPPSMENLNLNNIITLNNSFNYPIGFSDHTMDIHFSLAAVVMGACIIERHFTLDQTMEGFDHAASLNPDQFKVLVQQIRDIEKARGSFKRKPTESEQQSIVFMRRSIVASKDIEEDTTITNDMLEIKRPGNGISSKYLKFILGRKTNKKIFMDSLIELDDLI